MKLDAELQCKLSSKTNAELVDIIIVLLTLLEEYEKQMGNEVAV